jgi:hypothetical protein
MFRPAALKWGILTWPQMGEFEVAAGVQLFQFSLHFLDQAVTASRNLEFQ